MPETATQPTLARLKASEGFFQKVCDHLFDGVYFVDRERRILYWNKGAERLTGYAHAEVVGRFCHDNILDHVDRYGTNLCLHGCPLSAVMAGGKAHEIELSLRHKLGHRVAILVRAIPIRDEDNEVIGAVEVFSDNTRMLHASQKIEELEGIAYVDPLTGMGNRRHVEMQLAARQNDLQRHGWPFGVIFLDIDHFKLVNDTSGHDVGDEVLRMVARTLRSNLRPSDTVGRWGGEEFLVVLSNVEAQGLIAAANKLSVLVEKSRLTARDREISVTVSAGATLARPGERIDTLLKRVDGLLYRSKSAGRNRITTDVRSRRQVLARETQAV